jgi:hypothetical protein
MRRILAGVAALALTATGLVAPAAAAPDPHPGQQQAVADVISRNGSPCAANNC